MISDVKPIILRLTCSLCETIAGDVWRLITEYGRLANNSSYRPSDDIFVFIRNNLKGPDGNHGAGNYRRAVPNGYAHNLGNFARARIMQVASVAMHSQRQKRKDHIK